MADVDVDVLIVGAGLSGVGMAHHLQRRLPGKRYAILEARGAIGGTWDLFRFPGIRSDSDMHTLGYRLRPWPHPEAIADGPAILRYVTETAQEQGIDRHIRFHHRVTRAAWSTEDARWTVEAERTDTGETARWTCSFLVCAAGYFRYDEGFTPVFPGVERFGGRLVHPQHWPEDLDHEGRRVVVIGSGATAVTLVPALAERAAHVTMLQRSPSYVLTLPRHDPVAAALARVLPRRVLHPVVRAKNVALAMLIYGASRRLPRLMRRLLRLGAVRQLPPGYDVDTHFRPAYDPWDQRMCIVPDGDLFRAIHDGRASVVTDRIETFTERGVRLASGEELEADVVVTATGLNMLALGGLRLVVDGREVALPETMAYRSMMLSGVPNFAYALGYVNASWTLKADLVAEYVCRLLAHLDARGLAAAIPERDPSVAEAPLLDLRAGYVLRALDGFPKQGDRAPWRVHQNYARDLVALRFGPLTEGMRFAREPVAA